MPAGMKYVRRVHLLDAQKRKGLMIIYGEDLMPDGFTAIWGSTVPALSESRTGGSRVRQSGLDVRRLAETHFDFSSCKKPFLVRIAPRFALPRLMHYLNIQGSQDPRRPDVKESRTGNKMYKK